jgi:hypothetical protein
VSQGARMVYIVSLDACLCGAARWMFCKGVCRRAGAGGEVQGRCGCANSIGVVVRGSESVIRLVRTGLAGRERGLLG